MRIKILVLGLACLMICSCATAPAPRQIVKAFPIGAPFDEVWQAVIESFADLQLPIQNMEKDSGLITTDWIDFPLGKAGKEFCDCGGLGMNIETRRVGRFNVFVKRVSVNSCEIQVNCTYSQTYEPVSLTGDSVPSYKRSCVSTGKLEANMFELVKSKLEIE